MQVRIGRYILFSNLSDTGDVGLVTDENKNENCNNVNTVTGTFVSTYFRSRERKFHRWNFRSLELLLSRAKINVEISVPKMA